MVWQYSRANQEQIPHALDVAIAPSLVWPSDSCQLAVVTKNHPDTLGRRGHDVSYDVEVTVLKSESQISVVSIGHDTGNKAVFLDRPAGNLRIHEAIRHAGALPLRGSAGSIWAGATRLSIAVAASLRMRSSSCQLYTAEGMTY